MERNIYDKISQEINLKLPDINFDSDSDEMENGKPIKPFIRPAAEILFGWDDSESEAILDVLSKMPSDSSFDKKEEVILDSDLKENDNNFPNLKKKLPFKNILLPNGIKTHIQPEVIENETRLLLPNFGVHNNLDLDKILEQMDLSNYETTFFEDALTNVKEVEEDDQKTESINNLFSRLDEMSKKYEEARLNTNNSNVELMSKSGTSISLSNLLNQLKCESSTDIVHLDLRVENKLWATEIDPDTTKKIVNRLNQIMNEEESSDDEDKINTDNKELWIDSYRKTKASVKKNSNSKDDNVITQKINISEKTVEKIKIKSEQEENEKESDVIESSVRHQEDEPLPKNICQKIEQIKQREKLLSDRRTAGLRLCRLLPGTEDSPLLFHEETSFDPSIFTLLPTLNYDIEDVHYFSAFVTLCSPTTVLTISKVPSPISDGYPNENLAAALSVFLQMSNITASHFPFVVVGLQQIYYQNQLQLSLLCRTNSSLTKLKSELKKYNLKDMLKETTVDCSQIISSLPLSNILRILPYSDVINGNIWDWDNSSIIWGKVEDAHCVYDDHNGCRPLNIDTSCVVLQENFYLSKDFYVLVLKLLEKGTFSGIRLIYHSNGKKQLILAVRGFDAVNTIKVLQNKSLLYRTNVICTRFQENSLKELVKYFGPRLNDSKLTTMFQTNLDRDLANELSEGLCIYHSLYYKKPSDIILLVSPICIDVGWIINTLFTMGGYLLVNMSRLHLSVSVARQLGINEKLVDNFESMVSLCHCLIIRNENPMHSIRGTLRQCTEVIHGKENCLESLDQIFFPASYSDSILGLLDLEKMSQTPSIRELVLNIPDSPFDDCEQCSFVLLISDEFTRHFAQLLDQMSNLDLLAVKCMTKWPSKDHLDLIQSQFRLRLPILNVDKLFEESEGKMRIGIIVVRSMFLMKELEKIQSTIRVEKNIIFAYTVNVSATFGMVGSFFTSSELISDPRRRSSLKFLPFDIVNKLSSISILAQFPLIYSPIATGLSIKLGSSQAVISKFRQLWFMLTREGFSVVNVRLDDTGTLFFLIERPNAIFYLIQWAKSHFSNDTNVKIVTNAEEIEEFSTKILMTTSETTIKSLTFSKDNGNIAFIMIDESLLDSSPNMLVASKIFWNFLEDNNFHCISLSLREIGGADIFKLREVSLKNLSASQMKKESRYLCLLLTGSMIGSVIEDLLKCKINLLKTESHLQEEIYFCCDNKQVIECCNTILKGVIFTNINIDLCFN